MIRISNTDPTIESIDAAMQNNQGRIAPLFSYQVCESYLNEPNRLKVINRFRPIYNFDVRYEVNEDDQSVLFSEDTPLELTNWLREFFDDVVLSSQMLACINRTLQVMFLKEFNQRPL